MCMVAVLFDRSSKLMYKFIFHLSALLFFVVPLSIIFVLHILIAFHVRSSRKGVNRSDHVDEGNFRLTFILVSIVIALFICHQVVSTLNQYLFFISGFLFYLAPIVNPILYNVVSARFRKASKDILLSIFYSSKRPGESIVMRRRSSVNYIIAGRGDIHHCNDEPLCGPLL
nr:pyrokinin-1 receptor variant A [Haemonchus contortus]